MAAIGPARPLPSHRPPTLIKQYWPRYSRRAIGASILMQCTIAGLVASTLWMIGLSPGQLQFWLVIMVVVLASIPLNIFLLMQLLTPLKDLTHALSHVAGEPSTITPPNPNAAHFERDGFKPLLQYIYHTAATAGQAEPSQAQAQAAQIEAALDQTSAGIAILTGQGQVRYHNRHTPLRQSHDDTAELELLFEPGDGLTEWLAHCRRSAVHAEKTWLRIANKLVGEPGRRIFDITANYEKGSSAEVILVLHDRTTLYQPEDDDLDFIAFAAHELRGPITVIRGYLDVLTEEVGPALAGDQHELLGRLVVSANRLSGYVNNILNASKFDRRHLRVHLAEESVASIYNTIRDDMQLRATTQGRQLTVDIPATLPTIAADHSSLSEVLSNIIDNALKYSNEGGLVAVSAVQDGAFVAIKVQDHGIGIPANVMGNLFHKFYRSHRSRETVAGTGIGLYISKAIVESHGGQIGVVSREGEGSTFTITIPTYASVADKIADGSNSQLITNGGGWIKNHTMYKG